MSSRMRFGARRLVGVLLASALLAGAPAISASAGPGTAGTGAVRHPRAGLDLDVYQARVLHLVNQRRAAHHVHAVRTDHCVDRLSERWAAHLAGTGDFLHRDQHVVLRRCDMHWAGEALARGTALLPTDAVAAWMHSPEHRAILLKPRARRAGLGVRLDDQGRIVLVLNFADKRG